MTHLQLVLAVTGAALWLACGALVAYTVWALVTGRRTVSGFMSSLNRFQTFIAGLVIGSIVGGIVLGLAAHWWWPTVGH